MGTRKLKPSTQFKTWDPAQIQPLIIKTNAIEVNSSTFILYWDNLKNTCALIIFNYWISNSKQKLALLDFLSQNKLEKSELKSFYKWPVFDAQWSRDGFWFNHKKIGNKSNFCLSN